jgi:hypothetical protein
MTHVPAIDHVLDRGGPNDADADWESMWTDRSFVCVSDLAKPLDKERCRRKDQSIHVFKLPRRQATRRS